MEVLDFEHLNVTGNELLFQGQSNPRRIRELFLATSPEDFDKSLEKAAIVRPKE
jgi:hypothetical protein